MVVMPVVHDEVQLSVMTAGMRGRLFGALYTGTRPSVSMKTPSSVAALQGAHGGHLFRLWMSSRFFTSGEFFSVCRADR